MIGRASRDNVDVRRSIGSVHLTKKTRLRIKLTRYLQRIIVMLAQ